MTDTLLLRYTKGPTIEVAPAVQELRSALAGAVADLLAVPDAALEKPWPWRGEEADVRYGFYRLIEAIAEADAAVARALAEADGPPRSPAARRIAPATAARWDLHGLLAGLPPDLLDADPGGGEWSIRRTLGHVVSSQRGYADFTAWWLARSQDDPDYPKFVPEDVVAAASLPDEDTAAPGSVHEIRASLDEVLDAAAGRLGALTDDELRRRARWSGIEVDVGFRIGRWSSHLVEHTLQVDKTLVMLGRHPTEVERLVRIVHAAWGRVEALVFPMPLRALGGRGTGGRSAADTISTLGDDLAAAATSVRAAAFA
jgi:uncharacterized damage-inducible protein DinB